jgi:hypothetical protein
VRSVSDLSSLKMRSRFESCFGLGSLLEVSSQCLSISEPHSLYSHGYHATL